MSRATTKPDLIEAANNQLGKLWTLINTMSKEEQSATFVFEDRDKNLRDVLVHLYEWHKMVERWHKEGTLEGGQPEVPGKGFTWKTLPALNQKIWEKHQAVSLAAAKTLLEQSHAMILSLIERHTNDELFSKGVYKWTKSTTLGAYFVSCTASHYDWAMKKIKLHIKTYKQR